MSESSCFGKHDIKEILLLVQCFNNYNNRRIALLYGQVETEETENGNGKLKRKTEAESGNGKAENW